MLHFGCGADAVVARRRHLILLHHYYSSLEAVVSQASSILEARLYLYTGNTQYFCLRGPRQRLLHGFSAAAGEDACFLDPQYVIY